MIEMLGILIFISVADKGVASHLATSAVDYGVAVGELVLDHIVPGVVVGGVAVVGLRVHAEVFDHGASDVAAECTGATVGVGIILHLHRESDGAHQFGYGLSLLRGIFPLIVDVEHIVPVEGDACEVGAVVALAGCPVVGVFALHR